LGNILDLGDIIDPCTRVIRTESYRKVLGRIVSVMVEKGEGVSLYELEKEGVLESTSMLVASLKRLTECGYTVYVERGVRRRRDYYPTPLGMAMDLLLKLYSPDEMGVKLEDEDLRRRYFYMACQCIGETISRHMGLIFRLTYPLYIYMDGAGNIYFVETDEETLVKGFKTAQYLATLICMKVEKPLLIPSLEEDVPRFRRAVERAEKHLKDLRRAYEKSVDFMLFGSRIFDHLMKMYKSMDMYIDKFYRVSTPLDQMKQRRYIEMLRREAGEAREPW
jgi:hypothetical protein